MPKENVKDLLEEMKNLSELMLDLGYSSLFFENEEIANEVNLLYERLEEIEEKLYSHLFAASRGRSVKKMMSVIGIIESTKMVANAAKNLGAMVLNKSEFHSIIKDALKESDESIAKAAVKSASILRGKKLGELKLRTEIGMLIIAIRRGAEKKWLFRPKKDTTVLEGDILIGVGPSAGCEKLQKLASGDETKI